MNRIVLVALIVGCSKDPKPEVKCGADTVLQDGVCMVATAVDAAPFANVAVDAPVPSPAKTPTADARDALSTVEWTFREETDKMRGSTGHIAALESPDIGTIGSRTLKLGLGLIKNPERTMFVLEGGIFDCSLDGCVFNAKFDDGPVKKMRARRVSSQVIGPDSLADQKSFRAALLAAKKLVLEIDIYENRRLQFSFEIPELRWPSDAGGASLP